MRTTTILISLGWVLAGLPGVATADDSVELKTKYAPGLQLHYKIHETRQRVDSGTGITKPVKSSRDTTREVRITVLDQRADGGYDVRVDTTAIKTDVTTRDKGRWRFDSAADKSRDTDMLISPSLRALSETPLRVALDRQGKFAAFAGMKRWVDVSHPEISALYSGDYFEGLCNRLLLAGAPARPVKVGDSWERDERDALGRIGEFVSESVAAVAGIEQRDGRTVADVFIETITSVEVNPMAKAQGVSAELLEPTDNVEATFDPQLGHVTRRSSTRSFTLVIGFPGEPEEEGAEPPQQEQRIQIESSSEMELLGHQMLSGDELAELRRRLPNIKSDTLNEALRERGLSEPPAAEAEGQEADEEKEAGDEPDSDDAE